jgi:hypothetical protein
VHDRRCGPRDVDRSPASGTGPPPKPQLGEPLTAAADDLVALWRLLLRAGNGSTSAAEVRAALETYWQRHAGALHTTAVAISEQVRCQMLQALRGWRDGLARQAAARREDRDKLD